MLASATGARMSVRRLSIAAAKKKSAAEANVNARTKPTDSVPEGIARSRVRGLAASYLRSAIRLKAIALERAPTIATVIQMICCHDGSPLAASTAPRKAKGSANSVCSILIISSVVRIFRATVTMILQTRVAPVTSHIKLRCAVPLVRDVPHNQCVVEVNAAFRQPGLVRKLSAVDIRDSNRLTRG